MTKKKKIELMCQATNETLYSGWFKNIAECVEAAINESVCLDGVDLRGANLACANLDDAQMAGADLSNANLNGANLSEGIFDNARMRGADLSNACFAMLSLMNVDMTGASFSSTDVTDAVISGCQFSCSSVFTTLFGRAAIFTACCFVHADKGVCKMTKPPVVVSGLYRDIVYLDSVIKIGNDFVTKGDLIAAGERHLEFIYGREIAAFIRPTLSENFVTLQEKM